MSDQFNSGQQMQAQPKEELAATTVQAQVSTSVLAIAGLVLGALAILGAFVPLLNYGAVPFALVGLLLAIVGLEGIRNGKHSGRGVVVSGIVPGALVLVVICGMSGCAGTVASSAPTNSIAGSSVGASSDSAASSSSPSVKLSSTRTDASPLSFFLPKGWVSEKGSNGNTYYYPSKSNHTTLIYPAASSVALGGMTEQAALEETLSAALKAMGEYELVDSTSTSVSGYPAIRARAVGTTNGVNMSFQTCLVYASGTVAGLLCGSKDGEYDAEISACLDSLEVTDAARPSSDVQEESPAAPDTASSTNAAATSGDAGAVSQDLKEALDSYESFIDDYIAFMERYANSDDTASMLSDYLSYMQKYTDFMEKINAVDSSSLSPADRAYYIEVTTRVSKKLLDAAI